jgi:hypothetical protein
MMKTFFKLALIIFQVLSVCSCFGQGKFRGRIIFFDGVKKPAANVAVRLLREGDGTTGTDGIFTIAIHDTTRTITLELVKSPFAVIYPANGVAQVPKGDNQVIDFYIGDSPKDILTKAVAKSDNELKARLTQLGIKQDGIEKTLNAFRDDIQKMSDIKIANLKDAIDLDSKRREFYPEFAAAINNYINEAKDLKDAFKFTAKHAFDDPQALQVLTDAINSYDIAFKQINNNHAGYEKMVLDLWESEAKASEVREFFNYALGELHKSNIFVLNLRIKDINDYNLGHVKGSKKAFKEMISHDIDTLVFQLDQRLQELDSRARVILNKLAG